MFAKADVEIIIQNPQRYYTAGDRVEGRAQVTAKKDFMAKNIYVKYKVNLITVYVQYVNNQRIEHREKHILYDSVINYDVREIGTIKEGETRALNFSFTLPASSNCHTCGATTYLPASGVYRRNHYIQSFHKIKALVATEGHNPFKGKNEVQIDYIPPLFNGPQAGITLLKVTKVWHNKLKKRVEENYKEVYGNSKENEKNGIPRIVSNPLSENHKKSRAIRSLFNDHYKAENYQYLARNVILECEFSIPEVYSREDRETEKIQIKLRSHQKLKPHFILQNNESSLLGSFRVQSIHIDTTTFIQAVARRFRIRSKHRTTLLNKVVDSGDFDVVDFVPSIDDPNILEWKIPINKFFEFNFYRPYDLTTGPDYIGGCGTLTISHILKVILFITDNVNSTKKFEFELPIKFM